MRNARLARGVAPSLALLAFVAAAVALCCARSVDAGCADALPGSPEAIACRPWSVIYSSKEVHTPEC
jgi:hypothetical protein